MARKCLRLEGLRPEVSIITTVFDRGRLFLIKKITTWTERRGGKKKKTEETQFQNSHSNLIFSRISEYFLKKCI